MKQTLERHYHDIIDALLSRGGLRPHQSWLLTSPEPKSGNTATLVGLAGALAKRRHKLLLIDANLRSAALHERFGLPQTPGLAECLRDGLPLKNAVRPATQSPLGEYAPCVLPTGEAAADTYDLLMSPRLPQLLSEASQAFDLVLVDSPALATCGDALLLAPQMDGVVLVLASGDTRQRAAVRAKEDLVRTGAKLQGVILNRFVDPIPALVRKFI
jgi:capsular exopolysaccharide synthesis family protein